MACKKSLAKGQWWNFCGETDMEQTLPVQCTECGGQYILKDDPNAEQLVKELNAKLKKESDIIQEKRKKEDRLREATSTHAWVENGDIRKEPCEDLAKFFEVHTYTMTEPAPKLEFGVGKVIMKARKSDTMESRIKHVLIGGLLSYEMSSDKELDYDDAVDHVESLIPSLIEALTGK